MAQSPSMLIKSLSSSESLPRHWSLFSLRLVFHCLLFLAVSVVFLCVHALSVYLSFLRKSWVLSVMESLLGSFTVPDSHGTFFFNDDVLLPLRRGLPVVSLANSQHLWKSSLTRQASLWLCSKHRQWSFYFLLSNRSLAIQSLTTYSHMYKHTICLPEFPVTDSRTPLTPSLSPSLPLKSYRPYLSLSLCLLNCWMLSLQDPILHRNRKVLWDPKTKQLQVPWCVHFLLTQPCVLWCIMFRRKYLIILIILMTVYIW